MSITVLIPAAGAGTRMGASINKQYLSLAERPVLAHTVALFEAHPAIDHIFLISPQQEIPYCRHEVVAPYGFVKVRDIVAGGAERQDSVRNGLLQCGAAPDDIVLIHDGVRPLVRADVVDAVIASVQSTGAAITAVPVKDTIKTVADGVIQDTPDRSRLWQAQTPQGFRYELILRAHQEALRDGFAGTDDASLVERLGHPVAVVSGDYRNIKITTPEDLVLAHAFLSDHQEKD